MTFKPCISQLVVIVPHPLSQMHWKLHLLQGSFSAFMFLRPIDRQANQSSGSGWFSVNLVFNLSLSETEQ